MFPFSGLAHFFEACAASGLACGGGFGGLVGHIVVLPSSGLLLGDDASGRILSWRHKHPARASYPVEEGSMTARDVNLAKFEYSSIGA